jgi:hypothetical protein
MFWEAATAIGEFAIAAVIVYEVEQTRAAAFFKDVQEKTFYDYRRKLYQTYASLPGNTLKERAEKFRDALWADPALIQMCDAQWIDFNRLQYSLGWLLGRFRGGLLAKWFPHVMVSFWVMTAVYIRQRQKLRGASKDEQAVLAIKRSLRVLRTREGGFKPLTLYAEGRKEEVIIKEADLEAMYRDLDGPFR